MHAKNLSLNPFISTQNELSLIIHTGYKHYSYNSQDSTRNSQPSLDLISFTITMQSWTLDTRVQHAIYISHCGDVCVLGRVLSSKKKVSFTHDDAVEINQANQTSQWPHLCFWKGNMKCLHRRSHLQPDKLPSTLQSVRCPEANLSSSNFWTLFLATSNTRNVQQGQLGHTKWYGLGVLSH